MGIGLPIDRGLLRTYLNDHLAAATAGVELVRRTRSSNEGTRYEAPLSEIADALEANRGALRALMEALGMPVDRVKLALAWTGEKAGRLKPNNRLLSYSPLSRVVELEALTAGAAAQRSMWQALERIAHADERIAHADLPGARARAERVLAVLEELRPPAVDQALGPAAG